MPDFILFVQHGWADTAQQINRLAQALATTQTEIVAPNLGWLTTWLRIDPLITKVEQIAATLLAKYPRTPWKIVGHSMGGLIWLEVLDRHPEWLSNVHSVVLVGSPVGGSDLGRLFDPLNLGLGIARDLGKSRRLMAEAIALVVPTLTIAGDLDNGSDGTVPVTTTKFRYARFECLPGLAHAAMRDHPNVVKTIREFWNQIRLNPITYEDSWSDRLIDFLRSQPGMTDAHPRDFGKSSVYITFSNDYTVRLWTNPARIEHVFVADQQSRCLYSGYIGWLHIGQWQQTLKLLPLKFETES